MQYLPCPTKQILQFAKSFLKVTFCLSAIDKIAPKKPSTISWTDILCSAGTSWFSVSHVLHQLIAGLFINGKPVPRGNNSASSADQLYSLFSDIHVASVILYIISWADRGFSVQYQQILSPVSADRFLGSQGVNHPAISWLQILCPCGSKSKATRKSFFWSRIRFSIKENRLPTYREGSESSCPAATNEGFSDF